MRHKRKAVPAVTRYRRSQRREKKDTIFVQAAPKSVTITDTCACDEKGRKVMLPKGTTIRSTLIPIRIKEVIDTLHVIESDVLQLRGLQSDAILYEVIGYHSPHFISDKNEQRKLQLNLLDKISTDVLELRLQVVVEDGHREAIARMSKVA